MWAGGLRNIIYDNRLYFCEVAAAFDRMLLGKANWHLSSGWDINSPNPFLRKPSEINQQAEKFCYRCGYCPGYQYMQSNKDPSIITKTNEDLIA
jgi:hypothetical protein